MLNIQNVLIENEIDWERQSEDLEEFRAGMQDAEPTCCPLCSRPLTNGDCNPCQVSFTMPF